MQPLPFKYKIKRGKCVIESNSTNTTIDLRTDDIIGDINGYNITNLEMWTHLLSGLGPTNNSVTLSIFRPTYSINILIPGKTTRQLDGVKETHTISQIKQMNVIWELSIYILICLNSALRDVIFLMIQQSVNLTSERLPSSC